MRTMRTGLYPTGRLNSGAAILAAAETVDVTLVLQNVSRQVHRRPHAGPPHKQAPVRGLKRGAARARPLEATPH